MKIKIPYLGLGPIKGFHPSSWIGRPQRSGTGNPSSSSPPDHTFPGLREKRQSYTPRCCILLHPILSRLLFHLIFPRHHSVTCLPRVSFPPAMLIKLSG